MCTYVYICICIYLSIYIYNIYVYVYIYIYIHIYVKLCEDMPSFSLGSIVQSPVFRCQDRVQPADLEFERISDEARPRTSTPGLDVNPRATVLMNSQ